jgi:hypothetical protein
MRYGLLDRASYKWIISSQAACLFGLASILICCLTFALFGVDLSRYEKAGLLVQAAWAVFGVSGTLGGFFLMATMKKYREMREFRNPEAKRSKFVTVFLVVGVWWSAVIYYLLAYLPARRQDLNMEGFGKHVSQGDDCKSR